MPKHDALKRSFKDFRDRLDGMSASLCSARYRSWIREDIRRTLIGEIENLKYRLNMLQEQIAEKEPDDSTPP